MDLDRSIETDAFDLHKAHGYDKEKLGSGYLTFLRRKVMVTIRVSTAQVSYEVKTISYDKH